MQLLNIALDNLPRTIDKVMWLDSDLIWLNDDWVVSCCPSCQPLAPS